VSRCSTQRAFGSPRCPWTCKIQRVRKAPSSEYHLTRSVYGTRPTDFFWDTPWGAIAQHRLGAMDPMSNPRRGGLLGGSSKPSKLAALAAKRKKKPEEKKSSQQPSQSTDRAVGLLDALGTKKPVEAAPTAESKIRKTPSPVLQKPILKSNKAEEDAAEVEPKVETPPDPLHDRHCSIQQGEPTDFAQTLFGGRHKIPIAMKFLHPYTEHPKYISADPFAKPSPDDIVLAAQSKGSWNA
jgi:elongation factor 1 alpha-like protein